MRSLLQRWVGVVIALSLTAATAGPMGAQAAATDASHSGLFHRRALFSPNLSQFTKWNTVVARSEAQRGASGEFCVHDDAGKSCVVAEWQAVIAELRALPLRKRVSVVNELFNRIPYVAAETNWHDPDHWETPFEFLQRGGQCQDYAIAKFMALAASGVPEQDLRLVVVRDQYLSLDHAVAVVYVDEEPLVLDNQIKDVMPASQLDRYLPYYAINRLGWWYFDRAAMN